MSFLCRSIKTSLIITFLLLFKLYVNGQQQVIGTFPTMQGGFESGVPASLASATIATGTPLSVWSFSTAAQNTGTAISTSIVRSGAKSFNWSNSSTGATLFSPTTPNAAMLNATSYVVQYYWYKNNSGSARALNIQSSSDGTAVLGAAVSSGVLGTNSVASTGWTKSTVIVNTGTSAANPRYGLIQLKPNGGSFLNLLLDDFCVYPGTAADVTVPASATSAAATSTSNTTIDITWNGLQKAGDAGGYVIVRSTTATAVTLNDNGIYGVGLNAATGGGVVVGIVDGINGLNTFTDAGLTSGTTYYYSIFAVDKAFNYAAAATCSAVASTNPMIFTSVTSISGFTQYAVPSASQTYTVSGMRLTGTTVDLAVSSGFQISTDNITWTSTLSLPVANGGINGQPLTIYVRLNAAASGTFTGTITHQSNGAAQVVVNLNGTADFNTRILTSVTSLSGFTQLGATPSVSQTYTVSAYAVTDPNVTINASAGYQLSIDNVNWFSSINLSTSGGVIAGQPRTIYVRLNDPVAGAHAGTITHSCTGAVTVTVTLNGTTYTTPALSATPTTLSFGNITLGQNASAQSFLLNGILLSPASGNINLTAPSGFLISTNASTGFTSSIALSYTGSTISNQTIYVTFAPVNDVAYSVNISIAGGGANPISISCTGTGTLYAVGDYGSVASGLWSSVATWKQWDGTSFAVVPTAIPTSANNVWVNTGHVVTVDVATRGSYPCKNLFVAGTLQADTYTKDDKYVAIYGTLLKMMPGGLIGSSANPTGDLSNGISVKCFNLNLLITGNGSGIYLSRLTTALLNCNLTIDHNITLTYHGTSNQGGHTVACFPEVANSTLTINAGKVMTFAPWASLGTTETTSTLHPSRSFTINVYGTINMLNSPAPNTTNEQNNLVNYRNSFIYGGVFGTGNVFSLNVYNGGLVNTAEIYPNGNDGITSSPACWIYNCGLPIGNLSNITIASGGTLSVYKMADFRVPAQVVIGTGTFTLASTGKIRIGSPDGIATSGATGHIQATNRNFSNTGVYAYEGTVAQITGTGMPQTVSGLIVSNPNHVTLTNDVQATDSINMLNGKLILGDKNVSTNLVRYASISSYFVTNGAGSLKLFNAAAVEKFFPVGPSITSYNPAWITNTGTADNMSVKVEPYALSSGVAWPAGVPRIFRSIRTGMWNDPATWEVQSYRIGKSVNRSWTITEDVAGGSNLSLRFQWSATDELPGFNRSLSSVVRFNGSVIDYPVAPIPYNAAAGANPYTQQTGNPGVTSTSLQFGVASDTSSSLLFGTTTNAYPNSSISNVVINASHAVTANPSVNTTCGDLQLDGTLNLSNVAGDNFLMAGNWNRSISGIFNANNNAVIMNGGSNTSIVANNGERFAKLILQKNSVSNTVTLYDSIAISRDLNINIGTLNLASKNVTLLSDSVATASLGTLNSNGAIQYSGIGRFVVERYINTGVGGSRHPKSWQMLAAPTMGQTIREAWMENGIANSNPVPGYGTQIVGSSGATNGFDVATTAPSMKVYSPLDSSYVGVANTGLQINNNQGYMIFVRGDRSVTTYNAPATPTILRSKGTVLTGDVAGPLVPANKFQSVANPYPATVNYTTVTKSGLSNFIYYFDPYLSSYYGYGGFQTIDLSNGNATPGGTQLYSTSGDYRTVQSGQAFFVRSGNNAGTMTFKESDKTAGSRLMTRSVGASPEIKFGEIVADLFSIVSSERVLVDGNKIRYDVQYKNGVDMYDAVKLLNTKFNFGIDNAGRLLAIDSRSSGFNIDTIQYYISAQQPGSYSICIAAKSLTGHFAILHDKYAKTTQKLDLSEKSSYTFDVTTDPLSMRSDRFYLTVYSKGFNKKTFLTVKKEKVKSILVSPNPVRDGIVHFAIKSVESDTREQFEITNAGGKLIFSGNVNEYKIGSGYQINLPYHLPNGLYILTIIDSSGSKSSTKFVCE